ncbi:energy-coupling factor ABC transporter permease [bacterium]|nr:energy-coupling factor ABC transporter permease [bacterium]
MHIPDGFVSATVNLSTGAACAALVGVAVARANRNLEAQTVPLLSVTAAFIFAAQMVNFPVAAGTSGHFMGALLAALLLGPWNALIVMTVVLVLQALLFADGGILALGSNLFNMGVVGGLAGYAIFLGLTFLLPKTRTGFLTSGAVAAWFSIVLASLFASAELALSGTIPFAVVAPAMAGVHSIIGVGEALITSTALALVISARPDLVQAAPRNTMLRRSL